MSKSCPDPFKGHRFPREITSYAVWLYNRFSVSLRDVEELLAYRGIEASYETVRNGEGKFVLCLRVRSAATDQGRATSGFLVKW